MAGSNNSVDTPERLVLVEDHAMMLDGLISVLSAQTSIEVVGTAVSVGEFREGIAQWDPTVVIADYQLPDGLGTEIPGVIGALGLETPVLLLSGLEHSRVLEDAIQNGCAGFVSKSSGVETLTQAILTVASGGSVYPAAAIRNNLKPDLSPNRGLITQREHEVLSLLAGAMAADEISNLLHLSPHTVRNHIRSILAKFQARSQLEAVVMAVRSGIVEISGPGDSSPKMRQAPPEGTPASSPQFS